MTPAAPSSRHLGVVGFAARALIALAFVASLLQGNGGALLGEFTWDDTYIYLASARTLLTTGRLAVSSHHPPMIALTSPPYTIILAALGTVADLEVAARLFDVALALASLLLLFDVLVLLLAPAAAALGIAFCLTLVFALSGKAMLMGLGGMETSLYAALFLGLIASDLRRGAGAQSGLIAGALCAVRPDGVLLPALIALRDAIRLVREPATRTARGKALVRFAILAALPVLVQSALFLHFTGSALPNTVQARTYFVRSICRPFAAKLQSMAADLGPLLLELRLPTLLGALGFLWVVATALQPARDERQREWRTLAAFLVLFPLPFLFLYPNSAFVYEGRYFTPFVLVLLLFGGRALAQAAGAIGARTARAPAIASLGLAVLLVLMLVDLRPERSRIVEVHHGRLAWDRDYRARIEWINRHTPPDARIAVIDLGHPLYFMQREPFDVLGLGNAEMIDYYRDPVRGGCVGRIDLSDVTARFGIDYVLLHAGWAAVVAPSLEAPSHPLEKIDDAPESPFVVYRVAPPPGAGSIGTGG